MKWTNFLQQHNYFNGNMTRKEAGQGVMTMAWDDENRLLEVKNEGNDVSRYRYGHDGERVLKSTPDGQTTYVNEYLTIRSVRGADGSQAVRSRVATKHIFAGSERVATKRVDSTGTKLAESLFNKANCNASANSVIGFFVDVFMRNKTSCPNTNASDSLFTNESAVVEEKEAYFYHSDHLGSIGIVTRDGELHDYTVFLPFGEQWIFQSTNQAANDQTANADGLNPLSPFQFTGKELDKYTGLTYFGARYYDPRVSVWLSADPIVNDYLGSSPSDLVNGGMFTTVNMNLYNYTMQNPVNLVDPDGEAPGDYVTVSLEFKGNRYKVGMTELGPHADGRIFCQSQSCKANAASGASGGLKLNVVSYEGKKYSAPKTQEFFQAVNENNNEAMKQMANEWSGNAGDALTVASVAGCAPCAPLAAGATAIEIGTAENPLGAAGSEVIGMISGGLATKKLRDSLGSGMTELQEKGAKEGANYLGSTISGVILNPSTEKANFIDATNLDQFTQE